MSREPQQRSLMPGEYQAPSPVRTRRAWGHPLTRLLGWKSWHAACLVEVAEPAQRDLDLLRTKFGSDGPGTVDRGRIVRGRRMTRGP